MSAVASPFPIASMACPFCSGSLSDTAALLRCERCDETYPNGEAGQRDLRLRKSKRVAVTYQPGASPGAADDVFQPALRPAADSQVPGWSTLAFDADLTYGNRLTPEFVSYFPRSTGPQDWMLDLGCGERNFEGVCRELTGLRYVGVDFVGSQPNFLTDAHALPFKDETFRFILSVAVLEHLTYPDVAMDEAFRVLAPNGVFAGTVAFLEPFHMDSHFHMTHLGLLSLLMRAGFEVVAIAPNREWSGSRAQAEMSLFPGLPMGVRRSLHAPTTLLSQALWALKQTLNAGKAGGKRDRLFETTGGFRFVARRPRSGEHRGEDTRVRAEIEQR